jgi:hypothetical protein|tara:strand:+ start:1958 stop:2140 length:183 start_codon:yes stop_codon:yes gene_type:complete
MSKLKWRVEMYIGDYNSPIIDNAELVDWFTIYAKSKKSVVNYLLHHNIKIEEMPNDKENN